MNATTMALARNPVQITMRATANPHTSVSTSPKRYASGNMTIAPVTVNGPTVASFAAMMLEATSVATNSPAIPSNSGDGGVRRGAVIRPDRLSGAGEPGT